MLSTYVAGLEEREYWLLAAYHQAQERRDDKNLVWIAASLATFHIEEVPHVARGAQWLESLERHLQAFADPLEAEEAMRLRRLLETLKDQPQNKAYLDSSRQLKIAKRFRQSVKP